MAIDGKWSNSYKVLHSHEISFNLHQSDTFKLIDSANSKFDLQIKEMLHIYRNKFQHYTQRKHVAHKMFI